MTRLSTARARALAASNPQPATCAPLRSSSHTPGPKQLVALAEAWHKGDATRIVLVFDVWHPDLTDKEVQFLSFLQRSRMRAEMKMEQQVRAEKVKAAEKAVQAGGQPPPEDDAGDNFYQLLQEAKDLLPDNSWWVQ